MATTTDNGRPTMATMTNDGDGNDGNGNGAMGSSAMGYDNDDDGVG